VAAETAEVAAATAAAAVVVANKALRLLR